jgi:hypothetical protein
MKMDHDIGSGRGAGLGEGATDPSSGPGDDDDPVLERNGFVQITSLCNEFYHWGLVANWYLFSPILDLESRP